MFIKKYLLIKYKILVKYNQIIIDFLFIFYIIYSTNFSKNGVFLMSELVSIVKRISILLLYIFIISLATYVPEDEIKNTNITPGDQLIIDLFK